MTIKFIHCTDTHLGKTHKAMRNDTETGRNLLTLDAERQFEKIIDTAIEEDVDFIIHAGDMFDRVNINNTDINGGLRVLSKLADHNIPFIVIAGNHDRPFTKGVTSPIEFTSYLANCHTIPRFGTKTLEINGKNVAIHGISYLKRDVETEFREILDHLLDKQTADYNIVLSHQSLDGTEAGFEWSSTQEPLIQRSVFPKEINYVAMGHIHKRQTLYHPTHLDMKMHYPGSPLVTDFGERDYKKAISLVEIEDDGEITIESIPLETRQFKEVTINLDNPDSAEAEHLITRAIEKNLDKDLFLGIRLSGRMRLALKSITMTNYYSRDYLKDLAGLHIYNKDEDKMQWLDEEGVSITYGSDWLKSPREELIDVLKDQEGIEDDDFEILLELGQGLIDEVWEAK